jgi:hypothetical protein
LTRIGRSHSAARSSQGEGLGDRERALAPDRGRDARHSEPLGNLEAGATVTLAVAARRRVDGDDNRLEAGLDRLVHQCLRDHLVAEAVELEPAPSGRDGGSQLARPGGRQRREAHRRAGLRRGPRHPDLPLRVDQALIGDRRHQQRHRERTAEQLDRGAYIADAGQHPRPQPPAPPGLDVVAQGQLIASTAGEVAKGPGIELLRGDPLDIRNVDPALAHSGRA